MATNKKKHLREEERFCIEKMLRQNKSLGEVARTLGRGLSTISEEVNANGGREEYDARKADHFLREKLATIEGTFTEEPESVVGQTKLIEDKRGEK